MITITATAETAVGNTPDMNGTFMNVFRNFHLPYPHLAPPTVVVLYLS